MHPPDGAGAGAGAPAPRTCCDDAVDERDGHERHALRGELGLPVERSVLSLVGLDARNDVTSVVILPVCQFFGIQRGRVILFKVVFYR